MEYRIDVRGVPTDLPDSAFDRVVRAGAYGPDVQVVRSVRVEAVIERPPPLPWVGALPVPVRVDSWPGTLLAWRWLDREAGTWVGIVRYQRDGLMYEHAISGELLVVLPTADDDASSAPCT